MNAISMDAVKRLLDITLNQPAPRHVPYFCVGGWVMHPDNPQNQNYEHKRDATLRVILADDELAALVDEQTKAAHIEAVSYEAWCARFPDAKPDPWLSSTPTAPGAGGGRDE